MQALVYDCVCVCVTTSRELGTAEMTHLSCVKTKLQGKEQLTAVAVVEI